MGEIFDQLSFGLNQNRLLGGELGRIELDPIGSFLLPENRDRRMGDLYTKLLQDWNDASGGAIFMHFTHCSRWDEYGRFGTLEYLEQPRSQAPKYDALLRWMAQGPSRLGF